MTVIATMLLGCGLLAASPSDPVHPLSGSWRITGNGTPGPLNINLTDGTIRGTIYGQPISGSFDESTGRLTFVRKVSAESAGGVQEWTGELSRVADSLPPQYVLKGTFKAIAAPEFGRAGETYSWEGVAVRLLPPEQDLQHLQGRWVVAQVIQCTDKNVIPPKETGLDRSGLNLEIDGNQLKFDGHATAIANDVSPRTIADEVGFSNFRVLILTLPNGRATICSYMVKEDGVEIAYPHTTSCHRGSGHIVYLRRAAD